MVEKFAVQDYPKDAGCQYDSRPSRKITQYLAAGLATLSAVALGTHLSWSSAAVGMLSQRDSEIPITHEEASWIGSLITLGACAGAIPAGTIATTLGPKRTLQIIALPLLAAWYIIAFSGSLWGIYLARLLAGLGAGATCVAAPMYVSELADPKIRGTLGTFFQLQITVGLLLGYIFGGSIHDFKLLALISSIVPIIFVLSFSFMPESPVFLWSKGQINEARKSLLYFRGTNYDVEEELTRIGDNIREATVNKSSLSDLYRSKANLKAMIISLGLMFFQQMSGINVVLFYAQLIFRDSGSSLDSSICAIIIGVVQVLATLSSTFLIDRLGRKILLIISGTVMAACLGTFGLYFYLETLEYDLSAFSIIPLICICIYLIVFSMGFGPVPWMMMGELFSTQVKGMASSISAAFNWMLAFTITKTFLILKELLGSGLTFGLFGIICAAGAIFAIVMVPETKGKDIDEVQKLLIGHKDVSVSNGGNNEVTINVTTKS